MKNLKNKELKLMYKVLKRIYLINSPGNEKNHFDYYYLKKNDKPQLKVEQTILQLKLKSTRANLLLSLIMTVMKESQYQIEP
jgi:hypothetical protein